MDTIRLHNTVLGTNVSPKGSRIIRLGDADIKSMTGDFAWQDDGVEVIGYNPLTRLYSPTGSGKQPIISAAAYIQCHVFKRRAIITVPNLSLGEEYIQRVRIRRASGALIDYQIPPHLDFRGTDNNVHRKGTIQGLSEFLLGGNPEIALTTHQTLVGVWDYLKKKGLSKHEAFRNTWWGFDEAHHLSGVLAEDEDLTDEDRQIIEDTRTYMGDIAEFTVTEQKSLNTAVCAATATGFRGDKVPLFFSQVDSMLAENSYTRSFIDHWNFLGFKEFNQRCVGYDDPIDILLPFLNHESCCLVYLPPSNQGFRRNNPELVPRMIEAAREKQGAGRVLDLINPATQQENFNRLFEDNVAYKKGAERSFDVIFAVNMLREGANYLPLTHVYDFAPSASISRNVQSVGRLMRQDIAPDGTVRKDTVGYTAFYPNLQRTDSEEKVRTWVCDFNNTVGAGMLGVHSIFDDTRIPSYSSEFGLNRRLEEVFGEFKDKALAAFQINTLSAADLDIAILCTIRELRQTIGDNPGWKGNLEDATEALKRYSAFINAATSKARRPREGGGDRVPDLPQTLEEAGLLSEEIREAGFDITTIRRSFVTMFGADTDAEKFQLLDNTLKNLTTQTKKMQGKDKMAAEGWVGHRRQDQTSKKQAAARSRRNKHKKLGNVTCVTPNVGEP